jgi:nicotinate phosphoribosyltransferase
MSIFNHKRLTDQVFKLDVERMRQGWYSDKYFENVHRMLTSLAASGYCYDGQFARETSHDLGQFDVGNVNVEMQFFTRRKGKTLVVGVDKALAMLRHCSGYWENGDFAPRQGDFAPRQGDFAPRQGDFAPRQGDFVETWEQLQVWALHDGDVTSYPPRGDGGVGDPRQVQPVLRVRGRYRDFALLETPIVGALSRGSRTATNVYHTLVAARGKPVLFFPARFDAHEVQAADGYAYDIAVQRFNLDYEEHVASLVSTDAQGDYWGGSGGGTVPHAIIACFLGDTAAAMLAFASTLPLDVPRIALVDFDNHSVQDSLRALEMMFRRYRELQEAGDETEANRYVLFGVRLDTSGNMRDAGVPPLGDPTLDLGVNPRLVFTVRQALDNAWTSWDLPPQWEERARNYCQDVKIVVSGGFGPAKINRFEKLEVPVDFYGVGSSLMSNDASVGTNTDFTADVVRVQIAGEWVNMAKMGRRACDNPRLERVW